MMFFRMIVVVNIGEFQMYDIIQGATLTSCFSKLSQLQSRCSAVVARIDWVKTKFDQGDDGIVLEGEEVVILESNPAYAEFI